MADRVYPSSKPNGNGMNPPPQTLNGSGNPSFPATKAQLYGQSRPVYRPQPKPRRRSRSCCCSICLWVTVFLIGIILLAAIAGAIFWVIYHPQRPSFAVKTLQISRFNITTPKNSSPILKSNINFTISSRNPNKKIVFIYDPILITMKSNGVDIGNGSFPSYVHQKKNTTSLKTLVTSGGRDLDSESVKTLNSDLKKSTGLPLEIQLETKVKVKIGGLKTNKLPIRVICKGAQVTVPQKKGDQSSMKGNAKCKVHLKIKIWKWTLN